MSKQETRIDLSILFDGEVMPIEMALQRVRCSLEPEFEMEGSASSIATSATEGSLLTMRFRPPGRSVERANPHENDRVAAHCDLMDGLQVPNGVKAIAIALHEHWSADHRARFGEPASPSTVKNWRTERSRRRRAGRTSPPPRRDMGPRRVVRGLRRHHAIRTNASGSGMKEGYRRAIAELQTVNEGGHRFYGRPDMPLPPFSYETFRLDCLALRRGGGRRR